MRRRALESSFTVLGEGVRERGRKGREGKEGGRERGSE